MNQSGRTQSFDPRLGQQVTTYRFEDTLSLSAWPTGSYDHTQSISEGIVSASYKVADSASGHPRMVTQVETQPLLTHPIFRPGGTHGLSDADRQAIALAFSDPALWATYVAQNPSSPLGWFSQFQLWGVESWLAPVPTIKETKIVTSTPDFSVLGTVKSPESGGSTLPQAGNWLVTGMESEQIGTSTWMVTTDYRGSVNGPWDPDIYPTSS